MAKQIFAQGEACGARISLVDLTACATRTSILGTSPAEAWPANAPNDEVLAQKDRANTTDPTAWLRLSPPTTARARGEGSGAAPICRAVISCAVAGSLMTMLPLAGATTAISLQPSPSTQLGPHDPPIAVHEGKLLPSTKTLEVA